MRHLLIFFILGTCWMMACSSISKDKMYIFQKTDNENNKTLLVVTWAHEGDDEQAVGCDISTDLRLIEEAVKESNNELIRASSELELEDIIKECTEISRQRFRRDADGNEESSPEVPTAMPSVCPGTKWCGSGSTAKNYDDLGFHQDTDRCCRAHDLCNDTLAPGETKYNLTNKLTYTALSCACDNEFYNCLDRTNTMISNGVGNMFFNILRSKCFGEDYPLTQKCKKYRTFLKLKCIEYERDTKAEKIYQWIPAKMYKKIPLPGFSFKLP